MTLSSHQKPYRGESDDWLTPPEIINALAPFSLDPCASVGQPWKTASKMWTERGLERRWNGFVWCNPPFGPEAGKWLDKMAEHGNGIGLVPARTETRWFVRAVWHQADAVLFLHGRPHFHHPDGTRGAANSGVPICLVAYGDVAVRRLRKSGLTGSLIEDWTEVA